MSRHCQRRHRLDWGRGRRRASERIDVTKPLSTVTTTIHPGTPDQVQRQRPRHVRRLPHQSAVRAPSQPRHQRPRVRRARAYNMAGDKPAYQHLDSAGRDARRDFEVEVRSWRFLVQYLLGRVHGETPVLGGRSRLPISPTKFNGRLHRRARDAPASYKFSRRCDKVGPAFAGLVDVAATTPPWIGPLSEISLCRAWERNHMSDRDLRPYEVCLRILQCCG